MKKYLIALYSIFLLFIVSCKDDDPTDDGNDNLSGVYFPLKIGNWWKNTYSGYGLTDTTITYTTSRDTTISGKKWLILTNDYNNGFVMHRYEGNILMMKVMLSQKDMEYQIFDENGKAGDSLVTNFTTQNTPFQVVSKILEKGGTKTIRSKDYHDVLMVRVYIYTNINQTGWELISTEDDYFAKNIGPIKVYSEGIISKELMEYSLVK